MNIMVFAYLDNNLGDDLMIRLAAERFPQHQFLLYSNSSMVRNTFYKYPNITVQKISAQHSDLRRIDFHLTIGGSLFQVATLKHQLNRLLHLRRIKTLDRMKVRSAVLGANLGPFLNRVSEKIVEWELRNKDLITFRDRYSLEITKTFSLKRGNRLHLGNDIVYSLHSKSIPADPKSGLGISVYRSQAVDENNCENYRALAAIADEYIRKTGKSVHLFAFDTGNENDLVAAHLIKKEAKHKENFTIEPYLGDQDDILRKIKACERIIAVRFHSAILADVFRIPFLPVIYSDKTKHLLQDRGFNGLSLRLSDLTSKLDAGEIADMLIEGTNLFTLFLEDKSTAMIHFNELEKLLVGVSSRKAHF